MVWVCMLPSPRTPRRTTSPPPPPYVASLPYTTAFRCRATLSPPDAVSLISAWRVFMAQRLSSYALRAFHAFARPYALSFGFVLSISRAGFVTLRARHFVAYNAGVCGFANRGGSLRITLFHRVSAPLARRTLSRTLSRGFFRACGFSHYAYVSYGRWFAASQQQRPHRFARSSFIAGGLSAHLAYGICTLASPLSSPRTGRHHSRLDA